MQILAGIFRARCLGELVWIHSRFKDLLMPTIKVTSTVF